MDELIQKPNMNFSVIYSIDESFDNECFLKLRLRVCHDGLSPNNTYFTKQVMEAAKETIKNKPILAHVKYDDNGVPILGSHDMHIEQHRLRDGEEKVIYDEIPIGLIPEDCNFKIDEFDGINYVFVDAYIWRDYSNYAEELIEDAVNTKLSMEISIPDDSLFYNAKERFWEISKFKFRGITMLNENLGTGMKKALATTENFSIDNPIREKMIILMEALNDCLSKYNVEKSDKGGKKLTKFEELLQKYNKTVEDITFEFEGLTDEELELKFSEIFKESTIDNDKNDANGLENKPDTFDGDKADKFVKIFELSHDDIRAGLYVLLNPYELADETWYYIQEVFDSYFIYRGWINGTSKIYKQSYTKDKDTLSLLDERTELFEELLTASERAELESLRTNYSKLQEFKSKYDTEQKEAILNSSKYSVLSDNSNFIKLKENLENYSIEELSKECKLIFADYVLSLGEFTLTDDSKTNKLDIPINQSEVKKPYGGYFDKYIKDKN